MNAMDRALHKTDLGLQTVFDEIIVGAGSSGAVVAARLSEDQQRQVLLIEAGPDYPHIATTPPSLLESRRPAADHDWGLTAEMVPGRSVPYARGKVVGGCSSVNSCLALRGTPEDYDEWAALGNFEPKSGSWA
jgi:choline dehydrogenase-like flavoprotein